MYHAQSNTSFSMLFGHRGSYDEGEMYSFSTSPPSSSVDCTLSLGTPSTRMTNYENNNNNNVGHSERQRNSCMSNFGWNILPSKNSPSPSTAKSHRGGSNGNSGSGGDPLLARRCANCDTTSTPLWRNGPRGPKSLCNACGIRYKKEERRATAAAATNNAGTSHGHGAMDSSQYAMNNNSWGQPQKMPYYASNYGNEFRFIEEDDHHHNHESENGVPFMSWRFNVADRTSLVHDFTR